MSFTRLWSSLLISCLSYSFVAAAPQISISLQSSFQNSPYLIELLESAAIENVTSYYPLVLDIANGRFHDCTTDQQLYEKFADILIADGHLQDSAVLSSWKLALALHEAVPRVAAHLQYYTSSRKEHSHLDSPVEAWKDGRLCEDLGCETTLATESIRSDFNHLDIDRWSHPETRGHSPTWTLYADLTSPSFGVEYKRWRQALNDAHHPYRLRYKPSSKDQPSKPLRINGRSAMVAIPGDASHTAGMALIACIAVAMLAARTWSSIGTSFE